MRSFLYHSQDIILFTSSTAPSLSERIMLRLSSDCGDQLGGCTSRGGRVPWPVHSTIKRHPSHAHTFLIHFSTKEILFVQSDGFAARTIRQGLSVSFYGTVPWATSPRDQSSLLSPPPSKVRFLQRLSGFSTRISWTVNTHLFATLLTNGLGSQTQHRLVSAASKRRLYLPTQWRNLHSTTESNIFACMSKVALARRWQMGFRGSVLILDLD